MEDRYQVVETDDGAVVVDTWLEWRAPFESLMFALWVGVLFAAGALEHRDFRWYDDDDKPMDYGPMASAWRA